MDVRETDTNSSEDIELAAEQRNDATTSIPGTDRHAALTQPLKKRRHSAGRIILRWICRFLFNKKTIVTLVVLGFIAAGYYAAQPLLEQQKLRDAEAATRPQYQTLLPDNTTLQSLGGWKRVSPPENDPVFAYVDTIGDVAVTVSQQPLPKTFKNDVDAQTAELAKKYSATSKIDAGGIMVYVGTSAKGPQSAILTKNGLLILIKSQTKVADSAWAGYVKSLK